MDFFLYASRIVSQTSPMDEQSNGALRNAATRVKKNDANALNFENDQKSDK